MDLYHVYNRGVDKREVVLDDGDRVRFVHGLYVLNDANATPNYILHSRGNTFPSGHIREPLVHIYAWCLMPNHYHLLLSPIDDDPQKLSKFAQKFGMGYSKFFNEKYERTGALWQGKYKKVVVQRDGHFLYLPYYIHLNPLDLTHPLWRQGRVINAAEALKALREYRWSSYRDYRGEKNFPSILEPSLLSDVLGSPKRQEATVKDIISSFSLASASSAIEM